MEILIRDQNKAVLLSLVLGVFVGILYDAFKLFREIIFPRELCNVKIANESEKRSQKLKNFAQKAVIIIFDLIYCLILCPIFCVFSYITVNGRFRWFIFAAAFLGALLYKISLGRPIGIIISHLSSALYKLRHFIFRKIKLPLEKLSGKIKTYKTKKRKKREEILKKKQRTVVFSYGKS